MNSTKLVDSIQSMRETSGADFQIPSFQVSRWAAWSPALQTEEAWKAWAISPLQDPLTGKGLPSVQFLPIAMRKKLSEVCKVSLFLMNACLEESQCPNTPIVMASRHGESQTTVELLESIRRDSESSPLGFSRSVHNASVGLFSIAKKNHQPNTAIAAMEDTFRMGLLESALQLAANPQTPVLYIFADESIPSFFQPYVTDAPVPYGLALLLTPGFLPFTPHPNPLTFLHQLLTPTI